jgi:hypothetical protein
MFVSSSIYFQQALTVNKVLVSHVTKMIQYLGRLGGVPRLSLSINLENLTGEFVISPLKFLVAKVPRPLCDYNKLCSLNLKGFAFDQLSFQNVHFPY